MILKFLSPAFISPNPDTFPTTAQAPPSEATSFKAYPKQTQFCELYYPTEVIQVRAFSHR